MSTTHSPSITPDLVQRFREIPAASLGHVVQTGFMDTALRPVFSPVRVVGPAVTLKLPRGDSTLTREAIATLQPGDVLVVDQAGDNLKASWGEMTSLAAKSRGVEGVIMDGAITDIQEIEEQGVPTYTRHISALVSRRLGHGGGINVEVSCGGVAVCPGDLIVADENGIVVVAPEDAEEVYALGRAEENRAPYVRTWLRNDGSLADLAGLDATQLAALLTEHGLEPEDDS